MCLGPLRDLYGTPRAPKRARFGLERPFWGPRRSLGSPGGPNLGPSATGWSNWVGRIHIMCSGPLRDHYGTPGAPKRARFGPERPLWEPRRALGSPGGPNLGPSATGWSNWVGRIHIMCSGPLRDHYGTPGAPKRARFGPERPLWEPRRALGSPGGPNLGPSATGWSNWVGRIHIMCSGPLRDHYGTPGAPKRARFGPERPLWEPRRALGSPGGPDLGPTATGWSNWVGHMAMMLNELT